MRRRLLLLLTVLVTALAAVVAGAPAAQAHAYLAASDPADGAVLESAPTSLVLTYSEHVELAATTITLVSSGGGRHVLGPLTLVASDDREAPTRVSAPLPALARGAYSVAWSTLSSDDLHATSGTFGFGVGVPAPAVGWSETAPDVPDAVLRALVLLGLLLGAAFPVTAGLLRRRGLGDGAATAVLARAVGGAALLGLVAGLALLASELSAHPAAAADVVRSRYGAWWTVRELGLAAVAGTLLVARRPGGARRATPWVVALGVTPVVAATAVLGHSGSGATGSLARVLLSCLHLASTATWVGTLVLLVVVLAARRPGRESVRSVLVGFAPVAVLGVAGTALTGVALAAGVVGSLDALLLTDYGRLLTAKTALVGLLMMAGALNHRRLRRGGRPLSRLVLAEAAGGLVVVLLTGLVTSGQPATERQLTADPAAPASLLGTAKVGDLQEELTLRPNLPGPNVAVLRVADSRRPSPGPVSAVSLGVVDASGRTTLVPATPLGDGRWSASVSLPQWGRSTVRSVVQRRGVEAVTTGDLDWTVAAPPGTPGVLVSRSDLSTPLTTAAWALAGLVALGLLVWLRRAARWRAAERSLGERAARASQTRPDGPRTVAASPPEAAALPGGNGH